MIKKQYSIEREGQMDFFDNYGIPYNDDNSILVDNTDGVFKGNILEFKLNINNLNTVLFQAIKYLSRMRIKGESVPATILLVDLNNTKVYIFKTEDYKEDVHKVYVGGASKNNNNFVAGEPDAILDYSIEVDSSKVKKILNEEKPISQKFMPIDIDENCIVGWAERYYSEEPRATKGDFLGDGTGKININGEIRDPRKFKGLINPYTAPTNEKFKYLMDCLNDRLSKKDLGAFYTPVPYCKKAAELVKMAVQRALDGGKKDYIILDRCAGTGNLEAALIGLYDKNGDELIKHCIVSTYEYYEYKVLNERIGDKVRDIIPPTEGNVVYENGKISNADAMSEDFINNPIIKEYIDDEDCAVILFENPPYNDESSGVINGKSFKSGKTNSFILENMKTEVKGVATNELANRFIWSGFKYYLREQTDSYIVFSPIKYWKQYNFVTATPIKGFGFNRQHFHASPSTIACIYWENKELTPIQIPIENFDIKNDVLEKVADTIIKKVNSPASKLYSKVQFSENEHKGMWCDKSGCEIINKKACTKGYITDEIIGYLEADSFQIAPLKRNITRFSLYDGHGCYITKKEYKVFLPLWCAKNIPLENWYEKDIYATTSDGGDKYTKDKDFLKSCLIYTCLSNQNKCLSFNGSDNRYYRNELCFDDTNGITVASSDLKKMVLDDEEKELIDLWNKILEEAKKCNEYNSDLTYGIYQITKELNTSHKDGTGKAERIIYDYPQLNGHLDTLRVKLKEYYKSHITNKMFEYELVK